MGKRKLPVSKNSESVTYTLDDIQKKFNKLSRLRKIEVLWEALDHMQSYNGRSRWDCIALAMGYDANVSSKEFVEI